MFLSLSSTCIQNFSNWHALFVVVVVVFYHILWPLRHEVGLHVDPQMIHFELFITCCAEASSAPQKYLFSLGS